MPKRPTLRDNVGRFRKTATIVITKELARKAQALQVNLMDDISKEMLQKYKENVELSYGPRGPRGREVEAYNKSKKTLEEEDKKAGIKSPRRSRKKLTYKHSGLFLDSIRAKQEGNKIQIVIVEQEYPKLEGSTKKPTTTIDVYKYLRYGTSGGGTYPYAKRVNPDTGEEELVWAYNYPTPAHLFEEHTQNYMNSYLDSLARRIKNGTYLKEKGR